MHVNPPRHLANLVLMAAALIFTGTAYAEEWTSVQGPQGKVSCALPAGYSQIERTSVTPVGKLTTVIQNYEDGERLLGFGVTTLPKVAVMMGGEKRAFGVAKMLLLNEFSAKQTGYKVIRRDGQNAGELLYTCDYEGSPHKGRALFILVGQNLYTLNALEPTGDSTQGDRLFASLKVN